MLFRRQIVPVLLSLAAAALLILLLAGTASRPLPTIRLEPLPAQFDGASAVGLTRVLAEEYPDRVTGSAGARRAADYLRREFQDLGYQVEALPFALWLHGERVRGENVVASLAGAAQGSVAVLAHYDGQTTSHQAAEDNASGVGVLLELARVLRARPHRRRLILAATDAEEWGMIGARALVDYLKSQQTVAVISIDYLNSGRAPALGLDCMGQSRGYTPLWLRQVMLEAGRAQGSSVVEPSPAWEWIERAIEVSAQDQGPLLRAGIPALNISTLTKDYAASRARYHTFQDTFRDFDPPTFRLLGATVEQAVSALDTLEPVPAGRMNYWRISSHAYLPGAALRLIQLLGLVPVFLAGVFAARNFTKLRVKGAGGIFIRPLVYLIPPVLALVALYALAAANILKRYELYPATPKDPFLYQIPARVWLTLVMVLFAGYWAVRRIRALLPPESPSFAVNKQVLFAWLCILTLCAFLLNPFATWLYLGLFAYAGLVLTRPSGMSARTLNALLLSLAALPFAALLYSFGKEIFLGWRILWYLVLQAAYGVWSPWAAVLFLLAVVLWIQLFRISVLGRDAFRTT